MNSSINVWKFIFSVLIVILHINGIFGTEKFQGFYIFAGWFFVFSGYTLAKRIEKLDKNANTFVESCIIVKDRLKTILPYYFVSCTIALIFKINAGIIKIEDAYYVHRIVYEYLLLEMTPLNPVRLTDTSWYLSAMWMALVVVTPLAVKYRKNFFRFSILIYIVIYMYFFKNSLGVYGPGDWLDIGYKGFYRAVADMSVGIFAYEISHIVDYLFKLFKNNKRINIITTVFLSILVTIIYVQIIKIVVMNDDGYIYYFLPFIFSIIIMLQMHINFYIFMPDNEFSRFLGKISMILFMNHSYFMVIIEEIHKDYPLGQKILYSVLYSSITTLIIYLIFEIINIIKDKIFNNVKEEDSEKTVFLIEDKRKNKDVIIRDEKYIENINDFMM